MNPADNPFVPGYGRQPPLLAGRDKQLAFLKQEAAVALRQGRGHGIVMFGPRGMGKTVLLYALQRHCVARGFTTIVTTTQKLLPSLASMAQTLLPRSWLPQDWNFSVQLTDPSGQLSSEIQPTWQAPATEAVGTLEQHLLKACHKATVLLIDEAHEVVHPGNYTLLLQLAQHVAETKPLLVVLAGTPGLPASLRQLHASFMSRADVMGIGPLPSTAAAMALKQPLAQWKFEIDEAALAQVVANAQGYPFFLQQWGRELWQRAATAPGRRLTGQDVAAVLAGIMFARETFYAERYSELGLLGEPLMHAANAAAGQFRAVSGPEGAMAHEKATAQQAPAAQVRHEGSATAAQAGQAESEVQEAQAGQAESEVQEAQEVQTVLSAITTAIMPLLPDPATASATAQSALNRLIELGFIWAPPGPRRLEPGIPSLLAYTQQWFAKDQAIAKAMAPTAE